MFNVGFLSSGVTRACLNVVGKMPVWRDVLIMCVSAGKSVGVPVRGFKYLGVLQVPRRKHLRGPDLDYTHPNTGQESQAKTVPSATAEKIQGLTNNPENFLCRDHRKCFVSVHLSVVWKQLQPRLQSLAESCALS